MEEEFRAYTEFIVPDVPRQSGCSNAVSLCLCERFPPGWAGAFLIRVNHDSSVENANYGGLGLLLPSLFVLLKQIEDLIFFIFMLFYTFKPAGLCCTHCFDSYSLEFGAFLKRFSQCLLRRLFTGSYRLQMLCT